MPGKRDRKREGSFADPARRALTEQLERIDEQLRPYDELVERRERLASALAALDAPSQSGQTVKKRVRLHEVAAYVARHPGVMPAEVAAALEVPRPNIQAHFVRNEGTVFEKHPDGWHAIEGWEKTQEAQR